MGGNPGTSLHVLKFPGSTPLFSCILEVHLLTFSSYCPFCYVVVNARLRVNATATTTTTTTITSNDQSTAEQTKHPPMHTEDSGCNVSDFLKTRKILRHGFSVRSRTFCAGFRFKILFKPYNPEPLFLGRKWERLRYGISRFVMQQMLDERQGHRACSRMCRDRALF